MKRNSKRLVAVLLSAGLCAGALSGCGTKSAATAEAEAEEEWSDVFVEPVAGISDDFIRGMDASAVLSVEKSGAKYYGYDGKEQDVFETLAESGVNYIRLRVWNDPYDENGNGYGGGDNDVATAIELGKRATQYGMKVNIDFHYSDFWADPKRQHAPKAWEGMSADEKADSAFQTDDRVYHHQCVLKPMDGFRYGAYHDQIQRFRGLDRSDRTLQPASEDPDRRLLLDFLCRRCNDRNTDLDPLCSNAEVLCRGRYRWSSKRLITFIIRRKEKWINSY